MASITSGNCRTVAPLIARYNDPDLNEVERVLLSTHLLQCPCCLGRLQEYRALDQQLRRVQKITLAPRSREAVLERITAPSPSFGVLAIGLVWRQAWFGAVTAISLTTLVLALGLATFRAAQDNGRALSTAGTANETLVRPLTTTILSSNPTQVVSSIGESLTSTTVVSNVSIDQPSAVRATVREVHLRDGRLVVQVAGAQGEERLIVNRDTVVLLADGRLGTLADVAVGATVQVQRDQRVVGGLIARQIVVGR